MVSFPNPIGVCRSVTSAFPLTKLHPATRFLSNTVFCSSLAVAGGTAATKWLLDPISKERNECVDRALQVLNTKKADQAKGWMDLTWLFGKQTWSKPLTQEERLQATRKHIDSYLNPEASSGQAAVKNPALSQFVKQLDRSIEAAKTTTPEAQDVTIGRFEKALNVMQKHTEKGEKTVLAGAGGLAAVALLFRLGVPQAALWNLGRVCRVVS